MSERDIFDAAVAIDDLAERSAYLDRVCAGDARLRNHIEGLLGVHSQVGSFLERPAAALGATTDDPISERPGTVIGPYKLMEQIGEGGMGLVFVAEQQQPVRRKVALKVIKPGMDTRQVVARFEAERQALALMDHPNIAKVHDGGTTDSGRPYFVMELVKGVPITHYSDQNQLTPRERLELFLQVCQAVQHAHQKGIIHRDVKPSNVLVSRHDATPVVKVIDFGIAKAVGQRLTDKTLFTNLAQLIGTPLYMSPEQAGMSDLDVDTRSDIYSLGVLLYELLTGTTPFDQERLKQVGFDELRRIIREEEPPKPSTRISTLGQAATTLGTNRKSDPRQLSRLCRGELDWIVMKALEKDRNRRYETASTFAADVQRYLHDEPVLACPPSVGYRFHKMAKRNKRVLLTAGLIVLALVAGIIGTSVGLLRAERAREGETEQRLLAENKEKAATERAAETEAALNFVENKVFAAARPKGQPGGLGFQVSLHQALEAAEPSLDSSYANQPLIEARLRMTLGRSFFHLGDGKSAAKQYGRARELYTQNLGPEHASTLKSMEHLAACHWMLGRYDEELALMEQVVALRKEKFGADDPAALRSLGNLANSYDDVGRYEEALKIREEILPLLKSKLGPDHPDTIRTMGNLSDSYSSLGRHTEALKLREEELALRKVKLGIRHPDTLDSMRTVARSWHALGRFEEARQIMEEALPLQTTVQGANHVDTLLTMHDLAETYNALGRHADALKMQQEALARWKSTFGADHPFTLDSMGAVAETLMKLNRDGEALPLIEDCLRRAVGKSVRPSLIPGVMELRLRLFQKRKDAASCRDTAQRWEQLQRHDANSLYTAACFRAVTAGVVLAAGPTGSATQQAAAEADQAMTWLKQAVAAGFKDASRLQKDHDLDTLRDRDDFRKLVAELTTNRK